MTHALTDHALARYVAVVLRLVSAAVVATLLGGTGCAPLYGGKPETLKKPVSKKRPPETAAAIPWVVECRADFEGDGSKVRRRAAEATPLTAAGNESLSRALSSPDPATRASLVVEAINKYKSALTKDPFNADATEALAAAYARVLYKGCSLKLLQRLPQLEANPVYEVEARNAISRALASSAYDGFRSEADSAVGH